MTKYWRTRSTIVGLDVQPTTTNNEREREKIDEMDGIKQNEGKTRTTSAPV